MKPSMYHSRTKGDRVRWPMHSVSLVIVAVTLGGCAAQRGPTLRTPAEPYSTAAIDDAVESEFSAGREAGRLVDDRPGLQEPPSSSQIVVAASSGLIDSGTTMAGYTEYSFGELLQSGSGFVPSTTAPNEEPENAAEGKQDAGPPQGVAPLSYFLQQALAAHPSIRAARQRVAAEINRIPQVTALPDPQFNNTFWPLHDNAIQTAAGRIANQMTLQQGIPFPEKLRTKGAIVNREVQIARAEVERIERQVTESVRLAYYELWYANRAIAIIEQTRELVADLTSVAESRYRGGGSQQDVLRAQLETDRLDDQLVQLKRQKQVAEADLAALVHQPFAQLPQPASELDLDAVPSELDSLIAEAERCNPSLQGLAAEIQRDRQQQRLACLQQYPDFMVGLNWGIVSDNDDVLSGVANGNDNLSVTFGTTLPIWRDKISGGVREANHRTSSTLQRMEAQRDEIYGRLRRLLAQANALIEQSEIYEQRIIPRTEDTLRLAVADYRGQRTDFFTLIETYRELLMFETQLARIQATLAGTIAQIDRTVGCPF